MMVSIFVGSKTKYRRILTVVAKSVGAQVLPTEPVVVITRHFLA